MIRNIGQVFNQLRQLVLIESLMGWGGGANPGYEDIDRAVFYDGSGADVNYLVIVLCLKDGKVQISRKSGPLVVANVFGLTERAQMSFRGAYF